MPLRRVALLTVLACLALAAPAAASERSEARQFAAAMEPELALTPEEGEGVIADYEARSAHIAATCLPSVKAAAKNDERALTLFFLYTIHAFSAANRLTVAWMAEGDARLAAVETGSPTLRRARAARRNLTTFLRDVDAAAPADFCAFVTGWQAKRWKGSPPGAEPLFAVFEEAGQLGERKMKRGSRLLKHHGATRAQLRAFNGEPRGPDLREPAPDFVFEALGGEPPERTSPDEGGRRTPYAIASGAHAG